MSDELLTHVLQWRWPGAHYVVSQGVIEQWDGPMAQPSDAEVAAAVVEYEDEQIEPWAALRLTRTAALAASDWTQIPDSPLDSTEGAAWASYRQALRDLPANTVNPTDVVWPPPPPA
jgi:hypothetical protein